MQIKEYLSKVMSLELSLYEQRNIINQLRAKKDYIAKNPGYKPRKEIRSFEKNPISVSTVAAYTITVCIISVIICILYDFKDESLFYMLFFWWAPPLVGCLIGLPVGALLGVIASAIKNVSLNREKQLQIQKDNEYIYSYNKDVDKYNDNCLREAQTKVNIIEKEIRELVNNHNETISALRKLYDLNIIYPKYRYMVAIYTFYEYFDSGRCTELEGHEGAYNLFENELRFGKIFQQLDTIIQKLDTISQSQYELRNAIIQCNNRITEIVAETRNMSNQLKDISASAKLIEYNTARSKEYTETLAWIKTYELLKN